MSNKENNKLDMNELIKKATLENTEGNTDKKSVDEFINKNLSQSQAEAVRNLLNDEEKTKALLNSDAAKMLFKKFFGGNGNG